MDDAGVQGREDPGGGRKMSDLIDRQAAIDAEGGK